MKTICKVCGSNLHHKRVDDAIKSHSISETGEVTITSEHSYGYDVVYCSNNAKHQVDDKLHSHILNIIDEQSFF